VNLTQTKKKTKEWKSDLVESIREALGEYDYVYVLRVGMFITVLLPVTLVRKHEK